MAAQKTFLATLHTRWDGEFEIDLAQERYEVEIEVVDEKETQLRMTLNRLYDLTKMGWFAETHICIQPTVMENKVLNR